jgi:signal transduction histidine kinase/CheY-like chemotaxis protein
MPKTFSRRFYRSASRISAPAVLIICLAFTLFMAVWSHRTLKADQIERFHRASDGVQEAVEERLRIYENVLFATRGLFSGSDIVSREDFHDFIQTLGLHERYPGFQGIGYTVRLKADEVPALERRMRSEGLSQFHVWPKDQCREYFSIVFIEPLDWRNQRALGFDMFSEPVRREAMARAQDTGAPAASGKVTLVQETTTDQQPGFLIYVPIYKKGLPTSTVEERRRALTGFVYSPYRATDLFNRISSEVHDRHPSLHIHIYDGSEIQSQNLLFSSSENETEQFGAKSLGETRSLLVAGRPWTMRVTAGPGFVVPTAWAFPYFIFALGTAISLLIFSILRFATQMNRQLIESQQKAEEANVAKSRFLATMSHEIRTPLGVITGFAELALDPAAKPQEVTDYLRTIRRNGQQLAVLIGEVLDLSKIEANRIEIEKVRFSFPELLEEIVSSLDVRARERGITLCLRTDQPIPEWITTDEVKYRQILTNLIGNAIKFTEKGGVQVIPRLLSPPEPDTLITLEVIVEDTGIGISRESQKALFRPFSQADSSMTRRFGGTGLGLALSRELARALGGDVELKFSEPGRGSIFSVRVLGGRFQGLWTKSLQGEAGAGVAAASGSNENVNLHSAPVDPKAALANTKVLVVDDSDDNQTLIGRYLRGSGIEQVDLAENGEQAIEKASREPYDVILMDIQMPVLDGHAATARLRANGYRKPIIALTAHAFKEERERALRGGFTAYLTKPVNRKVLIESIREATASLK